MESFTAILTEHNCFHLCVKGLGFFWKVREEPTMDTVTSSLGGIQLISHVSLKKRAKKKPLGEHRNVPCETEEVFRHYAVSDVIL